MAQIQTTVTPSQRRRYGAAMIVALVASIGLGGCAGTSGSEASLDSTTPYQVAGKMVANGPARSGYQACAGGASGFVDDCSGFARYYGP